MSILIIGIGNKYRSDDAVGLEIADCLSECALENCIVKKSSGEGIALINLWEDYNHVILIDAIKSGCEAGTIHHIDLAKENLQTGWFQTSSHLFALPEAVQLAKTLNKLPDTMLVYGIEGKNFDYGVDLSPEIQKAKTELINRIKTDIASLHK